MAQVLQGWFSKELHLYTKDKKSPVATLTIATMSSDPIDRDVDRDRRLAGGADPESSDEEGDDDSYSSDVDDSAGEMERDEYSRQQMRRSKAQSRNLKQKIVQALFKKLKASEGELEDVQQELQEEDFELVEDEGLYFDVESNDSENDDDILDDNTSIASAKRPGLRPYFDHSKSQTTLNQTSLTHEEAAALKRAVDTALRENGSPDDASDDPKSDLESRYFMERRDSSPHTTDDVTTAATEPQQQQQQQQQMQPSKQELSKKWSADPDSLFKEPVSRYQDQLLSVFGTDDKLPDHMLMVAIKDDFCQNLAMKLKARIGTVLSTTCMADVQATIAAVINKFQKYCSRHSTSPPPLRIGVMGPESYVRHVLKTYVEHFSNKPQDYQSFVRFLIIPTAQNKVSNYLSSIDMKYNSLFMDQFWKNVFLQPYLSEQDMREVEKRITQYLEHAEIVHPVPIAEALITARLPEESDSSQFFLPFVTEVRMGCNEAPVHDVDSDSGGAKDSTISMESKGSSSLTSSPRSVEASDPRSPSLSGHCYSENLDLMVDYWPLTNTSQLQLQSKEKQKEVNKMTIKSTFRSLSVSRLPLPDCEDTNGLVFNAHLKNRNKGVKRLMTKRDKESEAISVPVNKLVCTARNSGHTFNVWIDGKEWNNVKFFSLSHQWPTHIKQFPIGLFLNYGDVDQT
uniref:Phosphofurin acidic cluster sorting protein 1/2 C-terminal domain-containing protein n=2 Tax=Clytia hemisphaerica TaxID=252671 RepID=A0A7M5X2B9_9CNID